MRVLEANWKPVKIAHVVVEPTAGLKAKSPPIILLHGLAAGKDSWSGVSELLANGSGLKVYCLDARNHGDSEWSDLICMKTMAMDVSHFMEQNNIPKAIVIGHSMGGKVAMGLALLEPEKVLKLVAEDTNSRDVTPDDKYPYFYLQILKKAIRTVPPTADEETAKTVLRAFFQQYLPKEQVNERQLRSLYVPPFKKTDKGYQWKANMEAVEQLVTVVKTGNVLKGRYTGRTLFICGTKSTCKVIADKDYILGMFPHAKFHSIEGATHRVHMEYPEEFTEAAVEFIKQP